MKNKYLLPCTCGRQTVVDAAQAGQEVTCDCGAKLEVPTMRRLASLKPAKGEPASKASSSSWGARQAVLLMGALITVAAIGGGTIYGFSRRPPDLVIDRLSCYGTWLLWHELRQGPEHESSWEQSYYDQLKVYRRWLGVAGTIAGLGILTMGSSLLIPTKRSTRSARKPSAESPPRGRRDGS